MEKLPIKPLQLSGLIQQMTIWYMFLIFPEKRIWHSMQIISDGDSLHGMSNYVFWGEKEKYFKLSSAENFPESAKRLKKCTYYKLAWTGSNEKIYIPYNV